MEAIEIKNGWKTVVISQWVGTGGVRFVATFNGFKRQTFKTLAGARKWAERQVS